MYISGMTNRDPSQFFSSVMNREANSQPPAWKPPVNPVASVSTSPFQSSSRIAAGLIVGNVKRPLKEEEHVDLKGLPLSTKGGSPTKKVTVGGGTGGGTHSFKEKSSAFPATQHYHPYNLPVMAVQNELVNGGSHHSGSASPTTVNTSADSLPSSTTTTVNQNGHASSPRRPEELPDYFVALYGCSGYGELAIKLNTGLVASNQQQQSSGLLQQQGATHVLGKIVDNQAVQLWDEDAEVVLLAWAVVDAKLNKVVALEERLVRPSIRERDTREQLLQEAFRVESGLDEKLIRESPVTLDGVLQQIKESVRSRANGNILLVTLGAELLRQQLLPCCARQRIELPDYFFTYVDLFDNGQKDRSSATTGSVPKRLAEMLENNRLVSDVSAEYGKRHVTDMVKLIQFMLHSGQKCFESQQIAQRYEPGLCKSEGLSDDVVVRARGLPWQASDLDVSRFFHGLDIPRGGIALCLSSQGRRNGEAIVHFANAQQRDLALQRHKHHMQSRYIEVYRALCDDFQQVAGVCNSEAEHFLQRKGDVIIRMRGLPYDATATQVIDFFAGGDNVVPVVDGEDGVLFVKRPDGRATGDAFVLLGREEDGDKAISKNRQVIGTRYIELFRSTTAEVQQVLNKSQENRNENQGPLISTPPLMHGLGSSTMAHGLMMHSPLLTNNIQRNCIRLRGLPFEAAVEDILDFLGEQAKHIVVQGVHMVFNAQGQPSGEAFIQLDSEQAAGITAQERHNRYMNMSKYGKKNRYVEVYQCSPEEMNGSAVGGGIGLQSVRPLLPHGFAGLAPYSPFTYPQNLQMMNLSQFSPQLRPAIPGLYNNLPFWAYPTPPMSPTSSFPGSVIPGLMNGHLPNISQHTILCMRNLPYSATVNDIATFLQSSQLSAEAVFINRHIDGRPNGEAFVVFGSREEAERTAHERNRQMLGNRHVEITLLA